MRRNAEYIPFAVAATAPSGSELITTAGILRSGGSSLIASSMAGPFIMGIHAVEQHEVRRPFREAFQRLPPVYRGDNLVASVGHTDSSTSAMLNSSSTTRMSATLLAGRHRHPRLALHPNAQSTRQFGASRPARGDDGRSRTGIFVARRYDRSGSCASLSARLAVSRRTARTDPARERVTYEAAAEVLGVPVGIVRPRLSRGRDTLRRLMGISEEAKIATG